MKRITAYLYLITKRVFDTITASIALILLSPLFLLVAILIKKDDKGKTIRITLEVDFVCNKGSERVYIQSAYSLPDEDKQKQEQRSLTLTDDSFTKIIITADEVPTHTMPNGIVMMNIFDYLLN